MLLLLMLMRRMTDNDEDKMEQCIRRNKDEYKPIKATLRVILVKFYFLLGLFSTICGE